MKQVDIVKVANNVTMRFSMQIKAPLWGFWQEMSFIYLWKMDHGPIWILFSGIDFLFFLPTTPKILDYLKKVFNLPLIFLFMWIYFGLQGVHMIRKAYF